MTFEQILHAAEQLSPAEQSRLIEHLQSHHRAMAQEQNDLGLLMFDMGPCREGLTLRREDE
jgi:hypothetical protein